MILRGLPRQVSVLLVFIASAAAVHAADIKDLVGRLPGEANAIAVIDIERILKTPMAQKEGWKAALESAYGRKPLIVAPGTMHVALAALIDPTSMQSLWEVAVMDLDAAPAVEAIARGERGIVDTVGEKPAAWSPINAYFVQLDPQILGTVSPANRQFAARWARKKNTLGGAFLSSYLQAAAKTIESGTEFTLAMDLEDVVNPKRAAARIKAGELPCLVGNKDVDPAAIAKLIASLKGITLRIDISQEATAKCTVDFGEDAAALTPVAKQLFLEVLSAVGARLEDAEGWNATVKRTSLVLEGKLSPVGLRHLFSLIEPPTPVQVREAAAPPPAAKPDKPDKPAPANEKPVATSADSKGKAAQQYYQTIDGILDRLGKSLGTNAKNVGLADGAAWLQRDARRIARLPIKDVDADLVAWGSTVATRLRDASMAFTSGVDQARSRTSGMTGSYTYSDTDYGNENELARVEGQRRQAAQEERTRAMDAASGAIRDLIASRDQIRAEMVKRYGMEF